MFPSGWMLTLAVVRRLWVVKYVVLPQNMARCPSRSSLSIVFAVAINEEAIKGIFFLITYVLLHFSLICLCGILKFTTRRITHDTLEGVYSIFVQWTLLLSLDVLLGTRSFWIPAQKHNFLTLFVDLGEISYLATREHAIIMVQFTSRFKATHTTTFSKSHNFNMLAYLMTAAVPISLVRWAYWKWTNHK